MIEKFSIVFLSGITILQLHYLKKILLSDLNMTAESCC